MLLVRSNKILATQPINFLNLLSRYNTSIAKLGRNMQQIESKVQQQDTIWYAKVYTDILPLV